MKRPIPLVHEFMSPAPQTIQAHKTVGVAKQMMSELGVRHLPVLEGDKVVGVISERDLRLLEQWGVADVKNHPIAEAMAASPFAVSPQTPLRETLQKMSELGCGSALVQESGKIVGIFTAVDAMHALLELLGQLQE